MQIARQEAQPLPCLDRGPRQDDAVDLFGTEGRDGLRHSEIGFAGTGRADADGDGILFNGLEIFLLTERLGLDRAALRRHADDVLGDLADLILVSGLDERDEIAHLLRVDLLALGREREQCLDGAGRIVDLLHIALDLQLGIAVCDLNAELCLDLLDVRIERAEHIDELFDPFCIDDPFCH